MIINAVNFNLHLKPVTFQTVNTGWIPAGFFAVTSDKTKWQRPEIVTREANVVLPLPMPF